MATDACTGYRAPFSTSKCTCYAHFMAWRVINKIKSDKDAQVTSPDHIENVVSVVTITVWRLEGWPALQTTVRPLWSVPRRLMLNSCITQSFSVRWFGPSLSGIAMSCLAFSVALSSIVLQMCNFCLLPRGSAPEPRRGSSRRSHRSHSRLRGHSVPVLTLSMPSAFGALPILVLRQCLEILKIAKFFTSMHHPFTVRD